MNNATVYSVDKSSGKLTYFAGGSANSLAYQHTFSVDNSAQKLYFLVDGSIATVDLITKQISENPISGTYGGYMVPSSVV
jgi:hypothetical protein